MSGQMREGMNLQPPFTERNSTGSSSWRRTPQTVVLRWDLHSQSILDDVFLVLINHSPQPNYVESSHRVGYLTRSPEQLSESAGSGEGCADSLGGSENKNKGFLTCSSGWLSALKSCCKILDKCSLLTSGHLFLSANASQGNNCCIALFRCMPYLFKMLPLITADRKTARAPGSTSFL